MSKFSRGQQAQIAKRVRLRGAKPFTARDKKCLVCGQKFANPNCVHSVSENQEVLDIFSSEVDTD